MQLRYQRLMPVALSLALVQWQGALSAPVCQPAACQPDELKKQIQSLKVSDHYWHKIHWTKSVSEGLRESRASKKPVFVWAFIDYPDAERC
jgi:hypothetical protein